MSRIWTHAAEDSDDPGLRRRVRALEFAVWSRPVMGGDEVALPLESWPHSVASCSSSDRGLAMPRGETPTKERRRASWPPSARWVPPTDDAHLRGGEAGVILVARPRSYPLPTAGKPSPLKRPWPPSPVKLSSKRSKASSIACAMRHPTNVGLPQMQGRSWIATPQVG